MVVNNNILLLSTIYPLPTKDNKGTAVCHFFTREWAKMGYRVRVIHFQAVFPAPFYWLARMNRKLIAAKTGAVVYTQRDKGEIYESEGVEINRIPLFKPIPHGGYSKKTIRKAVEKIVAWNGESGLGHHLQTGMIQLGVESSQLSFYATEACAAGQLSITHDKELVTAS